MNVAMINVVKGSALLEVICQTEVSVNKTPRGWVGLGG
jgi:hypothetical protein